MTLIAATTFEAGVDGNNVSTDGFWTSSNAASSFKFYSTIVKRGSLAARCVPASTAPVVRKTYASSAFFASFYLYIVTYPAASTAIAQGRNTSTNVAQMRLGTTGNIDVRNNTTAVDATTTPLALNTWHRINYSVQSSTTTAEIYRGTNSEGSTPDDTLSGTYTQSLPDEFVIGSVVSTTGEWIFDDVSWDTTTFAAATGLTAGSGVTIAKVVRHSPKRTLDRAGRW